MNLGWYKAIIETLTKYSLPTDFPSIKQMPKNEWRRKVRETTEKENTTLLIQQCHKTKDGKSTPKKKTATIIEHATKKEYQRGLRNELQQCTKRKSRTIIIARYGMLECGRNYKGTMNETCNVCKVYDDENHRMNFCTKFKDVNLCESDSKADFDMIYANDINTLDEIIPIIEKVWNVKNANGSMNTLIGD